jgi:SAM-dependent methyltransferase
MSRIVENESSLRSTRAFWDANPCGVHAAYEIQRAQRYAMEPWVPHLLERIVKRHRSLLEVGCGQGVDSIELCTARGLTHYVGIDYSPQSVQKAIENANSLRDQLNIIPEYQVGNAEALDFPDAVFDAVYSMGVLHHTADEAAAIREVHRVLKPGGVAYVCLYRKFAPKVAVAKGMRAAQRGLDLMLGTDRCIYRMLSNKSSSSRSFGTMFHECFGVPYMKWYSRAELNDLFADFDVTYMMAIGANLGHIVRPVGKPSPIGYFWVIEATKSISGH